jgi:biopolymer transport protein ExbD
MAGVDVGGGSGKRRAIAADINMVPFIDLLFVTLAFLLITAVWTQAKQIASNAEVPGEPGPTADAPRRQLEVAVRDDTFELTWREGATVVATSSLPREAVELEGHIAYPELAAALSTQWEEHGVATTDCRKGCQTTAVLRTDDRLPFREVVAVLDALAQRKREATFPDGTRATITAFNTTFSAR